MKGVKVRIITSIIISLGLIISSTIFTFGVFQSVGLRSIGARHVQVKGLAEREVEATVGIWNLAFSSLDDDLKHVNDQIKRQTDTVVDFLKKQGFTGENIVYGIPELNDFGAYMFSPRL